MFCVYQNSYAYFSLIIVVFLIFTYSVSHIFVISFVFLTFDDASREIFEKLSDLVNIFKIIFAFQAHSEVLNNMKIVYV